MNEALDVPQVAAAALAVAAAAATGFGLRNDRQSRHARQRGWPWWVLALWLACGGALLAALAARSWARLLAELLLLQWPIFTLVGLRQFHARDALPGHVGVDLLLLALAAGAVGLTTLSSPDLAPWAAAAASAALLAYAGALSCRATPGRETRPLLALGVSMGLLAVVTLAPLMGGAAALDPLRLRAAATALGGVVAAFVTLMLVSERTERQLRDSRRRLRTLANMDALTQVPNRRHFQELAGGALQSDPPGSAVLLMFDVDHFKNINDTLGHAAGDRALTLVSGSMLENLRAQDAAGRHGGDEFVLLLRRADKQRALGVAQRIVAAVQRRAAEQRLPMLTLSFGLVQVMPGEPLAEALRRADQALIEAKRQGRACAVAAEGNEDSPVFSESQRLGLAAA